MNFLMVIEFVKHINKMFVIYALKEPPKLLSEI